jgi:hypothetical protein
MLQHATRPHPAPSTLTAAGLLIAATAAFGLFSAPAQAQPATDVYANTGKSPAFSATVNYVSRVDSPVPGRARANVPATVAGAQQLAQRPPVVDAPVTGRERAERQARAGISAGF